MKDTKSESLKRSTANQAHILATPIDFNKLVEEGALKKIGQSYYINNLQKIPSQVSYMVSAIEKNKNGFKLTFYKEKKQIKRPAEDSKELRD